MTKKILFIPGIFNPKSYQNKWRNECKKLKIEFIEFKNPFYSYFSISQMRQIIKEGIAIFKKNKNDNITIICHSFGGILINIILSKFKKYKISKIIFMGSPLNMNIFGMKKRKKILEYNKDLIYDCEVDTYGAYFDIIVPYLFTNYKKKGNYKVSKKRIFGDHLYFLFSKKFINSILKKI